MRLKLTFALLLLNLGLFAAIWFLDKRAEGVAEESRRVLPADFGQLDRLELLGAGGATTWRVERRGESWWLTSPELWPANPFAITALSNALLGLERQTSWPVESVAAGGRTLAEYGLTPPALTLRVGSGTRQIDLRFGTSVQVGDRMYLLAPDGAAVYVVGRQVEQAAQVALSDLRRPEVVQIPPFEVRSLTLQVTSPGNLRVRLARTGTNQWAFESPLRVGADPREVEAALLRLAGLRAGRFVVGADLAATGLANPAIRLTVEGNGRRQTVLAGGPVEGESGMVFAKLEDNPTVFTLVASTFADWQEMQEKLRQRNFVRLAPTEVVNFEVRSTNRQVELQRLENGHWQIVDRGPDGAPLLRPAEDELVDDLLRRITQTEAVRFLADAPSQADLANYELLEPQWRLTLRPANGSVVTLLLGRFDADTQLVTARLAEEPFVYLIRPDLLGRLRTRELEYRQRLLEPLPSGAVVRRLALRELATDRLAFDLSLPPGRAWPDVVAELPAEQQAPINTLLEAARGLTVRNFLETPYGEGYDRGDIRFPWVSRLEIVAELATGAEATSPPESRLLSYSFSERTGGGTQYGGSPSANVIFTLTPALIDALAVLLPPPAAPEPPPGSPATDAPLLPVESTPASGSSSSSGTMRDAPAVEAAPPAASGANSPTEAPPISPLPTP